LYLKYVKTFSGLKDILSSETIEWNYELYYYMSVATSLS
jgi:hypothetical protein